MQFRKRPKSDRSLEGLEARLRGLAQPRIPGELEARILAAVPATLVVDKDEIVRRTLRASRRWRMTVLAGASVAAAACFLAVRIWPEHEERHVAPALVADHGSTGSALQAASRPQSDMPWFKAREDLVDTEMPTFTWPVQEKSPLMVSTSLRPDLFD